MYDVIYILRNNPVHCEELKYSLRSLVNFPHGDVWIAGGIPEKIKPDREFRVQQHGTSKWARTTYTLRKICEAAETPEAFWLFNDDFFVLQKITDMEPVYNGTLRERANELKHSQYARELRKTADILQSKDLGIKNYAVHLPMLLEKEKVLEVLNEFDGPMFRSLYGNYWDIGGVDRPDVKIATNNEKPKEDAQFVSTSDTSFQYGEVGKYLRRIFPDKSKWEV